MFLVGARVERGKPVDHRLQVVAVIDTRHKIGIQPVAVEINPAFAGFGEDDEFVAHVAADRPGLGFHRDCRQPHAGERLQIGDEHAVVGLARPVGVEIEGIGVFIGNSRPRMMPKRGRTSSRNFHWM